MMNKHFMGQNGFIWAVGIVEDRQDPMKLGRCRVRMVGLHTQDKNLIPTDHLPWAYPLLPIGSAGVSGVGEAPVGPVENTWVLCFFRDGENLQDPIMLGVIPGQPMENVDDPRQEDKLNSKKIPTNDKMKSILKNRGEVSVSGESALSTISKVSAGEKIPRTDAKKIAAKIETGTAPKDTALQTVLSKIYSKTPKFKIDGLTSKAIREEQITSVLTSGEFLPMQTEVYDYFEPILTNAQADLKEVQRIILETNDYSAKIQIQKLLTIIEGLSDIAHLDDFGSISDISGFESIRVKIELLKQFDDFDSLSVILQKTGNDYLIRAFMDIKQVFVEIKGVVNFDDLNNITSVLDMKNVLGSIQNVVKSRNIGEFISDTIGPLRVDEALKVVTAGLGLNISPETIRSIVNEVTKLKLIDLSSLSDTIIQGVIGLPQIPDFPKIVQMFADGTGTKIGEEHQKDGYPRRDYVEEPDTNRLARGENVEKTVVKKKIDDIEIGQRNIPSAKAHKMNARIVNSKPFTEPETPYSAVYPYNHVKESESGHICEIDDTPGAERIHEYHRSGTFSEIHPNGTKVEKTVMDNFDITMRNSYVHVEGTQSITIDKGQRLLVNTDKESGGHLCIEVGAGGDYNITVDKGDLNISVLNGDVDLYANGTAREWIKGDKEILIEGNKKEIVKGNQTLNVGGNSNEVISGNNILYVNGQFIHFTGGLHTCVSGGISTKIAPFITFNPFS